MPVRMALIRRSANAHGMVLALFLLCGLLSWLTIDEQYPTGAAGARRLAEHLNHELGQGGGVVLLVARDSNDDRQFVEVLRSELSSRPGVRLAGVVNGEPPAARQAVADAGARGQAITLVACTHATAAWPLWQTLGLQAAVREPPPRRWPNFLKSENLLNVASQTVVIAVLAVGMTMVIVTGGIDLSVGSLIALSAVLTTLLIRDVAGGERAGAVGMVGSALAGISACAVVGLVSGIVITTFAVPPFIVTLAMMLIASGAAYILSAGQSIYQVPASFIWLGRGTSLGGIPNAVLLTALLYLSAHWLMTRTTLGRAIYAVGGNREAARLSGVPVRRVLRIVYAVSGALAGLGGVITASQLRSGSPTYGLMYELYVIAAVVVGGASLSGGVGRIGGTLTGACVIAVIQNGMNLLGVESYTQKIVLGGVILGAVLLDTAKKSSARA